MKIKKTRFTKKIKVLIMLVLTVVLTVPLFTNVTKAYENSVVEIATVYVDSQNPSNSFHNISNEFIDLLYNDGNPIYNSKVYTDYQSNNLDVDLGEIYAQSITSIGFVLNTDYFNINSLQESIIIRKDGVVLFHDGGYFDYIDLEITFVIYDLQTRVEEEVEYTNSSNNSIEFTRSYDNTSRPSPRTILRSFYIDKYKSDYNYINDFFVSYLRHIQASPPIPVLTFNIHYYGYMRIDRSESLNILSEVTNSTIDGTAIAERETLTFEVYKGIPISFGFYNTVTEEYFSNVDDVTNIRMIITFNYGNILLNNSYNIGIKYEVIHLNNTTTTIHMNAISGTYNGSTDVNTWNDSIQSTNANGNINNLRLTYTQLDGYSTGFQAGKQEGRTEGKQEGLNEGYIDGRDYYGILYQGNWISASQYGDIRYQAGLQDSDYNDVWDEAYRAGANDSFYSGMQKWLVPAIIVVLFGGGFLYFASRRRE